MTDEENLREEKLREEQRRYECPITGKLFLEPIVTNCGHVFEAEALNAWDVRVTKQAQDRAAEEQREVRPEDKHVTCPTCRQNIITREPAKDMAANVKIFLQDNPEKMSDQYSSAPRRKELMKLGALIRNRETERALRLLKTEDYLRYAPIEDGKTALHLFAEMGNLRGVKALVKLGTDVNHRDDNNQSARELAVEKKHKACDDYFDTLLKIDKSKELENLQLIRDGIVKYLEWREQHAKNSRLHRFVQGQEVHWHHGSSGLARAERLLKKIDALLGNWSIGRFQQFSSDYKRAMSQSSRTEHSLKSYIDRQYEPDYAKVEKLPDIQRGIQAYILWSEQHATGIRGITRFSHLRHGHSGLQRAKALSEQIVKLQDDCNLHTYKQFETAYKKAMSQSSKTENSLFKFIENALAPDKNKGPEHGSG
jgi:hypothetical protein